MTRYFDTPHLLQVAHAEGISPVAIGYAVTHAMNLPIDRTSACVGAILSYDASGRPIQADDPAAYLLESITIEVGYAR